MRGYHKVVNIWEQVLCFETSKMPQLSVTIAGLTASLLPQTSANKTSVSIPNHDGTDRGHAELWTRQMLESQSVVLGNFGIHVKVK